MAVHMDLLYLAVKFPALFNLTEFQNKYHLTTKTFNHITFVSMPKAIGETRMYALNNLLFDTSIERYQLNDESLDDLRDTLLSIDDYHTWQNFDYEEDSINNYHRFLLFDEKDPKTRISVDDQCYIELENMNNTDVDRILRPLADYIVNHNDPDFRGNDGYNKELSEGDNDEDR